MRIASQPDQLLRQTNSVIIHHWINSLLKEAITMRTGTWLSSVRRRPLSIRNASIVCATSGSASSPRQTRRPATGHLKTEELLKLECLYHSLWYTSCFFLEQTFDSIRCGRYLPLWGVALFSGQVYCTTHVYQ